MPGETPMWGNPMREREREREREILLFSFRKVQNSSKYTFPAKENASQHQNSPTKFCLVFHAKSVLFLENSANSLLYGLFRMAQNRKVCLEKHVQNCLDFLVKSVLLYGMYRSIQYGLSQQKNDQATKQKICPWDLCPNSLGKHALFAAHFPLSSILRKSLSISSRCILHTTQCILL
jgi:hypothetical protein